jgi:hypothetical protein
MRLERFLMLVLAIPILAVFGGIGVLAFQIGETWQSGDTRALISGATAACSGGFVVVALVLGLVVGVPLALRAYSAGAWSHRRWDDWQGMQQPSYPRAMPAPRHALPWLQAPPQVETKGQAGEWLSQGPQTYDLFDDEGSDRDVIDGYWRRDDRNEL